MRTDLSEDFAIFAEELERQDLVSINRIELN